MYVYYLLVVKKYAREIKNAGLKLLGEFHSESRGSMCPPNLRGYIGRYSMTKDRRERKTTAVTIVMFSSSPKPLF